MKEGSGRRDGATRRKSTRGSTELPRIRGYGRGSAAMAADPRQYQGLRSLVLVHESVWLLAASRYILFRVFSTADPSDVHKRLDSMYLQDDPFLGLQIMRI